MYSPQLEELIDAILADGTVSSKEMEILRRRAVSEGEDPEEVEIVVMGRLAKMKNNNVTASVSPGTAADIPPLPLTSDNKRASTKFGDLQKCPNCGAVRESGTARCSECGYAYVNINANISVQRLSEKIMQIESEYTQDGGFVSFFVKTMSAGHDTRTKRICNAITTFPVPSSKDDLIEFILFTKTKKKWNKATDDLSQRAIARAYEQKYNELVEKARIFFSDDAQIMELIKEEKKGGFGIFGRK